MVSGIGGHHTGRVDMRSGGLPNISVTLEDGRDLATALQNGALGDADYGLHFTGLSGTDVTDEVTGLSDRWRAEARVRHARNLAVRRRQHRP